MSIRKKSGQNNCTLDRIEIIDEGTITSVGFMALLTMKGYKQNEGKKFIKDVADSLKDTIESKDDLAANVTSKDREGFLSAYKEYTTQEGELIAFLEDLTEAFETTDISFTRLIEDIDTTYEELDTFSQGYKLKGLFVTPSEVQEAKRLRDEKNAELRQIDEDIEKTQEDIEAVQSGMADKIREYYEITEDVRLRGMIQEVLKDVEAQEKEVVKELRKLKKQKGSASKRERVRINKQRARFHDELLDLQSRYKQLPADQLAELEAKASQENAAAFADLQSARGEREELRAEMKQLLQESDEKREELRTSGMSLLLEEGESGTKALDEWASWLGKHEKVFDSIAKQLATLMKRMVSDKRMKPITISVPYLDACLLLHSHFGQKEYPLMGARTFLQRALLGQKCLTRKEWSDNGMFDDTFWKKQIKRVNKEYEKYGSVGIVAEAIKKAKVPPNFKDYLKDPKKRR